MPFVESSNKNNSLRKVEQKNQRAVGTIFILIYFILTEKCVSFLCHVPTVVVFVDMRF